MLRRHLNSCVVSATATTTLNIEFVVRSEPRRRRRVAQEKKLIRSGQRQIFPGQWTRRDVGCIVTESISCLSLCVSEPVLTYV